ncbi:ATP-dependent Clp protease proteolytic subunit S14 [Planctomyces bekefii]|uniref:ATP-dependent Clp protease proteolytic subunit n=1 Tax=Planctomyces bekefii TaxID=1653850 RepID=A0A5C6MDT6_9PLAN|nr:ATP-dependent Clp protease proteolytic subunit S14 [Planctomyces bekefii]
MTEKQVSNSSEILNAGFPDLPFADQFAEVKLLQRRRVFISEAITAKSAKRYISDLLALDAEKPGEPITLYLNSPGGEVNSGFAIYDTIRFIQSPVTIVNTGLCASIATVINVAAKKDRRVTMPNAKFLIHQPLIPGQVYGQASDLEITAREILKTREKINKILAKETGTPLEKVEKDTVRDYWMNAQEAVEYGLVSKIVETYKDLER